ncbi:GIY-YIG nuclease family protein [Flavobacteriaceae bacterium R38]|nr:GIY-YIG nuclease family protein [Flavobacteriaceae bacterium R38]
MYFVYVLYSPSFDRYYIGMTQDYEKRLKEHNNGKTKSTKAFKPWEIIYKEIFNSREEAIDREKYLKSAAGRRWRKENIRPRGATE